VRLHSKILLGLVPAIVAPLVGLGWIAYGQLRATAEERAAEQLVALASQLARQIDQQVHTLEANIRLFGRSNLMQRFIRSDDESERYEILLSPTLRMLQGTLESYPEYREIRVLLPDGSEDLRVARLDDTNDARPASAANLPSVDGAITLGLVPSPDGQSADLVGSQALLVLDPTQDPVLNRRELRGYLTVALDLSALATQIRATRIGERGHLFLADAEGRVIAHPDPLQTGRSLDGPARNAVHNGHGPAAQRMTLGDEPVVLAVSPAGGGLRVVGVQPRAELEGAGRRIGAAVAGITVVSVLLTFGLLYALLRHLVVVPVRRLSRAAAEIGAGNLTPRLALRTDDELGELGAAFVAMGANLRNYARQIEDLAFRDALTGLPNRRQFMERLEAAIGLARRSGRSVGLVFLDLDNFKLINDSLGHQPGDELLKEVAQRLSWATRAADYVGRPVTSDSSSLVARLGGDEFIVMLAELKDRRAAAAAARRLQEKLRDPFRLSGHELHVTASIGVSVFPADADSAEGLIRGADAAMYKAKASGRNSVQFYSEELNTAAYRRLSLEGRLRRAVNGEGLSLHYQPQVDTASGAVVGFEALLRWTDAELGRVPPDVFIPVAEEGGLILPIGEWVLREACRQTAQWHQAGLGPVVVAVNLSAIQLMRQDMSAHLAALMDEFGLKPTAIELELTETALMVSGAEANSRLEALRALGVSIALDDFGTGYSSLSYLRRLPVDKLKIDRSFIRDIETDPGDASIVAAILAMARALGIPTVAEGVENQGQLAYLRERGCAFVQGYLYGRPKPAQAAESWLACRESPVTKRGANLHRLR
jgi:diguanylate cyclase (GGDEF)-like protein